MSINSITRPAQTVGTSLNHRTLGTTGMLLAPALLISILLSGFDGQSTNRLVAVFEGLFVVGWAGNAIGTRQARATGKGRWSMVIFVIQMLGLAGAFSQQIYDLVDPNLSNPTIFYTLADIAWPLSNLYLFVVGSAVVCAGVWQGWRRYAPLLCAFALPLSLLVGSWLGTVPAGLTFGITTALFWMVWGNAVRSRDK